MADSGGPETVSATGDGNGALEAKVVEEWIDAAYNCFSSGHKFCREVCPVMQVTRDERHSPTAFHANVVALEKGLLSVEDVAEDYVHCTMCGACELRCPNTLFTGDFYRFRQRTISVVQAMRLCSGAVDVAFQRAGGGALYETSPLQRCFRDIHAAQSHYVLAWDVAASKAGKFMLGIAPDIPTL